MKQMKVIQSPKLESDSEQSILSWMHLYKKKQVKGANTYHDSQSAWRLHGYLHCCNCYNDPLTTNVFDPHVLVQPRETKKIIFSNKV